MKNWRCDRPMAEKKRVLKYCNKECSNCFCGITKDATGHEHHAPDMTRGSRIFMLRNLDVMSGRKI